MGLVSISANAGRSFSRRVQPGSLESQFSATLRDVQKVNGADDRYPLHANTGSWARPAQELFSKQTAVCGFGCIAGAVVLFGAVSMAKSLVIRRQRRRLEQASKAILTTADLETPAFLTPMEGRRRAR